MGGTYNCRPNFFKTLQNYLLKGEDTWARVLKVLEEQSWRAPQMFPKPFSHALCIVVEEE